MEKLNKHLSIAIYMTLIFMLFTFAKSCSTIKKVKSMTEEVKELNAQVDSLTKVMATKDEVKKIVEIEGLKVSKRILFDQNQIVRSVSRPDDKMMEYDKEIEKLNKK